MTKKKTLILSTLMKKRYAEIKRNTYGCFHHCSVLHHRPTHENRHRRCHKTLCAVRPMAFACDIHAPWPRIASNAPNNWWPMVALAICRTMHWIKCRWSWNLADWPPNYGLMYSLYSLQLLLVHTLSFYLYFFARKYFFFVHLVCSFFSCWEITFLFQLLRIG